MKNVEGGGPLVSICIPTYNSEATLQRTLTSIVAQTYRNLSIVVVDNASVDHTVAIARELCDSRIEVHVNETNIGAGRNFVHCIELARGKYTAIYHADDLYEADIVAKEVAFLEGHPEAGAISTGALVIDENDNVIKSSPICPIPSRFRSTESTQCFDFDAIFKGILRHSNFLLTPSIMVRTDIYHNESCRWREDQFGSSVDLFVWLEILRSYQFGICSEPLMRYRVSVNQGSQSVRTRLERADIFRVLDYYTAQQEMAGHLSHREKRDYLRLQRTDRAVRAMNCLTLGKLDDALTLTTDIFSRDSFVAALTGMRAMQTLLLGGLVRFMAVCKMDSISRKILACVRMRMYR
jgi:glycosyltransferase involved in cell wall biosynthesis